MLGAALITAALVVTPAQGGPAENFASFHTEDGPLVCTALAELLNRDNPELIFVCQKEGLENADPNPQGQRMHSAPVSYRF